MEVVGDFTDVADLESLVDQLEMFVLQRIIWGDCCEWGIIRSNGNEYWASTAVPEGCTVILQKSSTVLLSTDLHKQAQFSFQEFSNIARGSMYTNRIFNEAKITKNEVM